ncbi:MAG: hypothetical protein JKY89_10895 [Immundisolibacteraceae bacterium]|nr:hypothetical protein [Immundisolibacteraceae bacterium]
MNTDKLIPASFARKITPFVMKDVMCDAHGREYTIKSQSQLDDFNGKHKSDGYFFVVSFADRPNTGKQPVGDDVVVDTSWNDGLANNEGDSKASEYTWVSRSGLVSWKPNHAAMLAQYLDSKCPADDFMEAVEVGVEVKPIYTQAMCDAGELPPVGSDFIDEDGDVNLSVAHYKGDVIGMCADSPFTTLAKDCKPIRTNADKLRDAILVIIDKHVGFSLLEANSDLSAELLASDKFTITLNEPTSE